MKPVQPCPLSSVQIAFLVLEADGHSTAITLSFMAIPCLFFMFDWVWSCVSIHIYSHPALAFVAFGYSRVYFAPAVLITDC